ncbi:hypothetical protein ACNKHO_15960 [Shigella flexneri]
MPAPRRKVSRSSKTVREILLHWEKDDGKSVIPVLHLTGSGTGGGRSEEALYVMPA